MRKLILASVAVLGFAGVAAAQEAPALIYGQAEHNISNHDGAAVDYNVRTASVQQRSVAPADLSVGTPDSAYNINLNPNYSGK